MELRVERIALYGGNRMEVRYMIPADDRRMISKVYEESWKSAYKGIIPQEYLDSIPEGRWAPNLDKLGWGTMVCMDHGKIIGTSSFCKSRFERFQGWGEIVSIYLLPDSIGRGYGKILMDAVLSELKRQEYEDVFLWVLEENIRARNFYRQYGFLQTDDFLDNTIGGKNLREIRYVYKNR